MDQKQLLSLVLAIEKGSLTAAAEVLDVEPSSVSRSIRKLEEEFSIQLIERERRGVKPTEAGHLLLKYYQDNTANADALKSNLDDLRALRSGCVSIATGEAFVGGLVGSAMQEFVSVYPNIAIDVQICDVVVIRDLILNNLADIGLSYNVGYDKDLNVATRVLAPIVLVMPANHPAAAMTEPIQLSEIARMRVGLSHSMSGVRRLVHEAERAAGIDIPFALKSNSLSVLMTYVSLGLGVAILPACASSMVEHRGADIVFKRIDSEVLMNAEVNLITRRGRTLPSGAKIFMDSISRNMNSMFSQVR